MTSLNTVIRPINQPPVNDFGTSMRVSGDGTRLVVGDIMTGNTLTDGGCIYVFCYSTTGTSWVQEAKLYPNVRTLGSRFGWSVSINHDGSKIIVGAPYDNNKNNETDVPGCGAAYIFERTNTTWNQTKILKTNTLVTNDKFGYAVDINESGNRVIVGAPQKTSPPAPEGKSFVGAGAAYIFNYSNSSWDTGYLLTSREYLGSDDHLGSSVSINAIGNIVAIGARGDRSGENLNGAAYVFRYRANPANGVHWILKQKMLAAVLGREEEYGHALSLSTTGEYLAIGGFNRTTYYQGGGAVDVWKKQSDNSYIMIDTIIQDNATQSKIKPCYQAYFGWSVSFLGTSNLLLIGAPGTVYEGLEGAGVAYCYKNVNDKFTMIKLLLSPPIASGDGYGSSVCLGESSTGNTAGTRQMLVAAAGNNTGKISCHWETF